jgi:hypothetical protein
VSIHNVAVRRRVVERAEARDDTVDNAHRFPTTIIDMTIRLRVVNEITAPRLRLLGSIRERHLRVSCLATARRARRGPPSPGGRTSGASGARGREGRPAAAASAAMAQTLSEWASGRICDWCQEECDLDACDLNVLTCSFRGCPSQDSDDNNSVYHKECVEAYLKSSMERGSAKYVPRPRRRRVVVARESSDPRSCRTPLNSRRLPRSRA